jgi:hypothetical protein
MRQQKSRLLSTTVMSIALGGGALLLGPAGADNVGGFGGFGVGVQAFAACNPCNAECPNPCNPCCPNPCAAASPCNPCAAASACNPCNPCAAASPCNPCNPCAAANPCNPCAAN